jgi:hypothetical protein
VLGSILILENRSNLEATLGEKGLPKARADEIADSIANGSSAGSELPENASPAAERLFHTIGEAVSHDFALASRTVFYVMAGVMAVAFVVSLAAMPSGRVEAPPET